jgi:hypothetical protein
MKRPGAILLIAAVLTTTAPAQVFWAGSSGGFCGSRFTVASTGNPSFAFSFGGGWDRRPWFGPCRSWPGFWPGNYWLGPVNLVSSSSRRLPASRGPAPTVPDPVAILPASWVPQ